jgi:hypothetical protein
MNAPRGGREMDHKSKRDCCVSLAGGLILALLSLCVWSCDESLPPRDQPQDFLTLSFGIKSALLVIDPAPPRRRYDSLTILFTVANRYNDVLVDSAWGKATADIWLKDDPSISVHLEQQRIYDHVSNGFLIIRPNDSVVVQLPWNSRHPTPGQIWTRYRSTTHVDGQGRRYYQTEPIHLVAKGSIQLWKHVPMQSFEPIEFFVVYLVYATP